MEFHYDAGLHLAFFVWLLILVIGFAKKGERATIGAGGRFDDVRNVKRSFVKSSR